MTTGPAELSSLATSLDELVHRVTVAAEQDQASANDDRAAELFAVERSLLEALRRLRRLSPDR